MEDELMDNLFRDNGLPTVQGFDILQLEEEIKQTKIEVAQAEAAFHYASMNSDSEYMWLISAHSRLNELYQLAKQFNLKDGGVKCKNGKSGE